jgi:hypothetical protein
MEAPLGDLLATTGDRIDPEVVLDVPTTPLVLVDARCFLRRENHPPRRMFSNVLTGPEARSRPLELYGL